MKKNNYQSLIIHKPISDADINIALQPIKLIEYFSFTSLIIILLASIILSLAIADNAKRVLLQRSEAYSLLFAKNLNRQVFLQFVLPTFVRYGRIALSQPEQFNRLDTIIQNTTEGMRIDSVTIYDSKENIISYSTRNDLVGKRELGGIEYSKALMGKNYSVLESSGSIFNLLPGTAPIYCTLKTFIPFKQDHRQKGKKGNIMGVIEVVKDLSDDLRAIIELQSQIIFLSLTIMSLLFAVLSFIAVRANKIIETRANERLRLEEQLNKAERLANLGKMVAAVSHEIKNPLGIVRSTAEILRKRISKLAPGNEHLASIIVEETSRLDGIVQEFLVFARPNDPKLKKGSLNEVVHRLVRFMEGELATNSIHLITHLNPSLPEVDFDADQIYQVLLNIMFNAIHAMPEGGTVTIRTDPTHNGQGAAIKIIDTGSGMSEDKMKQIFTPFYTDKHRGTGLGLAIAKNIVEKHHGSIRVQSIENKSTTFTVTINSTTT
ncbi:MAG: ATP-binding protein [Desulfobulbaceae bacterium]|nr:ATP-binding protein [Desulfobulbaceae bacterium]